MNLGSRRAVGSLVAGGAETVVRLDGVGHIEIPKRQSVAKPPRGGQTPMTIFCKKMVGFGNNLNFIILQSGEKVTKSTVVDWPAVSAWPQQT
jgi:hypothetical protein